MGCSLIDVVGCVEVRGVEGGHPLEFGNGVPAAVGGRVTVACRLTAMVKWTMLWFIQVSLVGWLNRNLSLDVKMGLRVWPAVCVGLVTICLRERICMESSRAAELVSDGSSRFKLRSQRKR